MKIALTIAGSDSGAGAGIQADLKTFAACGVYGISAVTALTAQNTQGVFGVSEVKPAFVTKQLFVLMKDIGCSAAKTGMLFSRPIIEAVAAAVKKYKIAPLVVDPVMIAKGGHSLLRPEAEEALISLILPLAYLVTPNLDEARRLSGLKKVETVDQMKEAAVKIAMLGPKHVLVKGGHLSGKAVDVLFTGDRFETFEAERIDTSSTHGTGCTYSAAITAYLANGRDLEQSVARAKTFITSAIRYSYAVGHGFGPVNHFWGVKEKSKE
jgi:hydroxymethylpyrimidine/phosphomethylpyrimidine kinase